MSLSKKVLKTHAANLFAAVAALWREETYYVLAYQVPLTISFTVTLIFSPSFWGCKGKNFFLTGNTFKVFF